MYVKVALNALWLVTAVTLSIIFLYRWWAGTAEADWFVWVIFSIAMFDQCVNALKDSALALDDLLKRRRRRAEILRRFE